MIDVNDLITAWKEIIPKYLLSKNTRQAIYPSSCEDERPSLGPDTTSFPITTIPQLLEEVPVTVETPDEPPNKKTKSNNDKAFLEVLPETKASRTDEIMFALKNFVENDNMIDSAGTPQLTISKLLGYLLHRENYFENRKLSKLGRSIMNGVDLQVYTDITQPESKLSFDACLALYHDCDLGR